VKDDAGRYPHSLVEGPQVARNPFNLESIENDKKAKADLLNAGIDGKTDADYDKQVDKLISGGMELRKRMMMAEQNKDLDISKTLDDLLHNSGDSSGIFAVGKPTNILPRPTDYLFSGNWKKDYAPVTSQQSFNPWGGNRGQEPTAHRSKEAELESIRLQMDYPTDFRSPVHQPPQRSGPEAAPSYGDIKRHRLYIKVFKVLNPLLRERLRGKAVSLEVAYPVFNSSPIPSESYKFLGDEEKYGEQFVFNQEIDSELDVRKVGLQKVSGAKVGFILRLKGGQQGLPDSDLCRGELEMERILLAPNFDLKAQIRMNIVIDTDRTRKVTVSKSDLPKLPVIAGEAGVIDLETKLYNPDAPLPIFNQPQQALLTTLVPIEEPNPNMSFMPPPLPLLITPTQPGASNDYLSQPVCMFLHVRDIRCMPRPQEHPPRNIYLEHKIFGTPESIRSQICWNNDSPIVDHRVTIPLSRESIEMMKSIPLVISVWDKSATKPLPGQLPPPDELVGVCKVGLLSGYTLIGRLPENGLHAFMDKQGNNLLEIVDQFVPIRGLELNDDKGMMNVGVWLGNLKQIKHYNDNVQTLTESMLDALRKPKRQDSYSSGHTSQLLQETASDADVGLARFGDQDDDESSSGDDQIVDFSKKKPKKKTDKNKRKNREDEEEVESEEEDVEEEEEQRPSKKPNKKPKRKETSEEEVEEEEESPKKPKQKVKPPSKHRESEEEPDISDKGHDKRPTPPKRPNSGSQFDQKPSHDKKPDSHVNLKDNQDPGRKKSSKGDMTPDELSITPGNKKKPGTPSKDKPHEMKLILKEDDADVIKDPKTGHSYQRMPDGNFVELKKISVKGEDGKHQTVLVNPILEDKLSSSKSISKAELQSLKQHEKGAVSLMNIQPFSKKGSVKETSVKDAVKDPNLLKRLSEQEKSQAKMREFSYGKEATDPDDEDLEESDELELEINKKKTSRSRIEDGDRSKSGRPEQGGGDSRKNAIGSNSAIPSSKDHKDPSHPDYSRPDHRNPSKTNLSKSQLSKRSDGHNKKPTHVDKFNSQPSQNELDGSDAESKEVAESDIGGLSKPSLSKHAHESSTSPRKSKLSDAKNLKISAKFGAGKRDNDNYGTGGGSRIPSVLNLAGKQPNNPDKMRLPQDMFESKNSTPQLSPRHHKSNSNLQNQLKNNAEGSSDFKMDKAKSKSKAPKEKSKSSKLQQDGEGSLSKKRAEIPQFETLLDNNFFSDDILMSFTLILEYLRRFVFMDEALSERMDLLYLGQFQHQLSEFVNFEDLEYIMQKYQVFITKTELKTIFDFLEEDGSDEISLAEIHESLVAFLQIYETITFEFYEGFKELHTRIKDRISLEEFKDYLVDNCEKYHIRNEYLQDYIENYLGISNPAVSQTLFTCGDFLYFDDSYIFNILNYLLFVEYYEGQELSFEYINTLHNYQKFKALIEVKILFLLYEGYKIKSPDRDSLLEAMAIRAQKLAKSYPHKINFRQFCSFMKDMKIADTTVWENLMAFNFALKSESNTEMVENISKNSFVSTELALKYLHSIVLDKKTSNIEHPHSQIAQSLLIDKKKRPGQVQGEKFIYTYEISLEKIEDLNLARCDYCDLSVMYQFPGEESPIETQIFTYAPDEHEYDISISSKHSYSLLKKKGLIELFGKTNGLRIILTKLYKKTKEGIGLAIIPIDDLINPSNEAKTYFIHPLKQDVAKKEHLGILSLVLTSTQTRADLYADDILAGKVDPNAVDKQVDVERGVPTEGVLTVYTESLSKLNSVYGALEAVIRDVFPGEGLVADGKMKISLYLEFKEFGDDTTDSAKEEQLEEGSRSSSKKKNKPIIEPFVVELDTQQIETKVQSFRFIEKHVNRNHIISDWKHIPLTLDEDTLDRLSENALICSLFLECSSISGTGKYTRRLCGQAEIKLDSVLAAKNQDGYKANYGLVSETRDVIGYINCTLNYSKGKFERGDEVVQDLKTDLAMRVDEVKPFITILRLNELLLLKKSVPSWKMSSIYQQRSGDQLVLKVIFGGQQMRSIELSMPENATQLTRLFLEGHEYADQFIIPIDLQRIDEYISDKKALENFHNMKATSDPYQAIPKIEISLTRVGQRGEDDFEIGKYEIPLGELLNIKMKSDNRGLSVNKAYVPLMKKSNKVTQTTESDPCRLGFDLVFINTKIIKNKNTQKSLIKLFSSPVFSTPASLNQAVEGSLQQDSTSMPYPVSCKLLKAHFSLANAETSEILELLTGGSQPTNSQQQVDLSKLVRCPVSPPLQESIGGTTLPTSTTLDSLLKDFEYLDSEWTGHILYNDAFKVYNGHPQLAQVRKKSLELFVASQLAGENKCLLQRLGTIEGRFDYLVFLGELFKKHVSIDLNDVYYDNRFRKIEKDMEEVKALKDRIEGKVPETAVGMSRGGSLGLGLAPEERAKTAVGQPELVTSNNPLAVSANKPEQQQHYYDTWQDNGWRVEQKQRMDNPYALDADKDKRIEAPQERSQVKSEDVQPGSGLLYLVITVVKAERLLYALKNQAPNAMFKATFGLYSPQLARTVPKSYTSDVIPRQSSPEWNFRISYPISSLSEFYLRNKLTEIYIEIMHVESDIRGGESIPVEIPIAYLSGPFLTPFTSADINSIIAGTTRDVLRSVILTGDNGIRVYLNVEITANGESIDNPFKQALHDGLDYEDVDKESMARTKKTLEELRKQNMIPDASDREVISSQRMMENLKNTLSSSELFKPGRSSLVQGSQISRPRTEKPDYYKDQPNTSHPGSYIDYKDPIYPQPIQEHDDVEIHYEDHDSRDHGEEADEELQEHPKQPAKDYSPLADNLSIPNIPQDQPRPTPNFKEPQPELHNESQEGASSYNPFKQNLMKSDQGNARGAGDDGSRDSSPAPSPPARKPNDAGVNRPTDKLIKSLKDKLPSGGLREEDLERIERIFQNRKFDNKIFDLEDSDLDY